ncbi:sigma-70 family RNA polymerase sigma factor [Lutibacter sp.]|uniref:sigma-70 family RNA polymerase sigma factor n=1 Tax=Lutibacter sp. TaxID=1925666 RepID=UPI00273425B1|nr:sigma-70 family RNA polymerase sigma factor [Lutibacter sp.]MDP3312772.1 sigma-70 family RNA polymerase sigma factor [Lutibacter sp.]
MLEKNHILTPEKWVKLHADYLYNYTISRINNHEISKDLVQETFFAALNAMKNFEGKASERTWLIAILKRKIIDYYRKINSIKGKAEVRMNFYDDGEHAGEWIEERVPSSWVSEVEKDIENRELGNALEKCISALPEKYEIVFRMKTIEELETEEICKELDISSSNLWVIIHRARLQLRKCMEDNWFKK